MAVSMPTAVTAKRAAMHSTPWKVEGSQRTAKEATILVTALTNGGTLAHRNDSPNPDCDTVGKNAAMPIIPDSRISEVDVTLRAATYGD